MPPGRVSFFQAFLSSALGTGVSRLFGAVRDVVIAGALGAGATSDAFWMAFTIPNLFRRFVADEGLTGALIPAIAKAEADGGVDAARLLANGIFTALMAANLVLLVLGWAGAEWIVLAFAWSWRDDPEKFALTVELTRWLFPLLGMVSLVSLYEGLLNSRGHFFTPKLAPALISVGMAGSVAWLTDRFDSAAHALSFGVLVGGVAHVVINLPPLWSRWGPLRLTSRLGGEPLRAVGREMGKVMVIGVFGQLNLLVLRQIGAWLPDGAVTHYWNANRLVDLAQGIVAVAIGSALLPNVSAAIAAGDRDTLRDDLVGAVRLAAFLLLPVGVSLLLYGEPLTAMLFRRGAYTAADVSVTATTLAAMVPFMLAVALMNILKKVFFAMEDRRTLLWVGGAGVVLTGVAGVGLAIPWGVAGLGLALSVATVLQLLAYVVVLHLRLGAHLGLARLGRPLLEIGACLVPVVAITLVGERLGDWSMGSTPFNLALVAGTLGAAAIAYLGVAQLVGLAEVRRVTGRVMSRLRRRGPTSRS